MIPEYFTIQPVYANEGEEEEVEITAADFAGPGIAILIIIVATLIARRILKRKSI